MLPLWKTSPITLEEGLHPEGAAKTKHFRAVVFGGKRLEVPSLGTGGPKPPTPRAGTKELSDEACCSREPSPPFLLYHISFLAHGPSFQCAKMKQGGAQSSRFLWALESQAFGGRAPAVKLN